MNINMTFFKATLLAKLVLYFFHGQALLLLRVCLQPGSPGHLQVNFRFKP